MGMSQVIRSLRPIPLAGLGKNASPILRNNRKRATLSTLFRSIRDATHGTSVDTVKDLRDKIDNKLRIYEGRPNILRKEIPKAEKECYWEFGLQEIGGGKLIFGITDESRYSENVEEYKKCYVHVSAFLEPKGWRIPIFGNYKKRAEKLFQRTETVMGGAYKMPHEATHGESTWVWHDYDRSYFLDRQTDGTILTSVLSHYTCGEDWNPLSSGEGETDCGYEGKCVLDKSEIGDTKNEKEISIQFEDIIKIEENKKYGKLNYGKKGEEIKYGEDKSDEREDKNTSKKEKQKDSNKYHEVDSEGIVYVLENEYMNNVLKIGYTSGSPEERARSLSEAEGVPSDYEVVYFKEVADPEAEEMRVHTELSEYRASLGREFFKVDRQTAVNVIEGDGSTEKTGYICVFENEEIHGLVLIDSTTNTPTSKAMELSSGTGVPAPYEVAFKQAVEMTYKSELMVRKELREYKVDNKFFEVTVEQAKKAVKKCLGANHGSRYPPRS